MLIAYFIYLFPDKRNILNIIEIKMKKKIVGGLYREIYSISLIAILQTTIVHLSC